MILSYTKLFSYLFLFTTVESILVHTTLGDLPTLFWWVINALILTLAIKIKSIYYSKYDESPLLFVKLFLIWNLICIVRGFFVAENYWEWKNLFDVIFVMSIPFLTFLFVNPKFVQNIMSFWFKYMLLLVFLFIPFIDHNDFLGRYLAPIMLLLLVFPILPFRWKVIALVMTLLVLTAGFDARSNVIRFIVALLFGMFYYFRFLLKDKFFKLIHTTLIVLPILFFTLGVTGTFNIFKINEYIKGDYTVMSKDSGELTEASLTADTRTFIYIETISSALENEYVLAGRTPANGYDSPYFGDFNKFELGTGKQQRFSSEVSILNFFTWNGLIGVVLYFFIFFYSSYLAIYKSNNYFIKVIGLFVAFRWDYAFVEDFTKFDIQYMLLWILISMCLSSTFRKMNDKDFRLWTKGIFIKLSYRQRHNYKSKVILN